MTTTRYAAALAAIDAANAADPNRDEGEPKELRYGRRMSAMLDRFAPEAPEAIQLAVRAQHIERWKTPRSSYPSGRTGYLQWRVAQYRFHADTTAQLLAAVGYDPATIECVRIAVGKQGIKIHAEAQMLEDVAALVFLEHYLADFAASHPDYDDDRWRTILGKTWRKMSPTAHTFVRAGGAAVPDRFRILLADLLESGG
jgi:hypothetical protein